MDGKEDLVIVRKLCMLCENFSIEGYCKSHHLETSYDQKACKDFMLVEELRSDING